MELWPQYTIDKIAKLTPKEMQFLLNGHTDSGIIRFNSEYEYNQWLMKSK